MTAEIHYLHKQSMDLDIKRALEIYASQLGIRVNTIPAEEQHAVLEACDEAYKAGMRYVMQLVVKQEIEKQNRESGIAS